ncbi:MAG: redoxin domain-containing protein [Planctomycetota bacterium]|nr:redoxin domain-containing protein [Planctomycetota bacterium]
MWSVKRIAASLTLMCGFVIPMCFSETVSTEPNAADLVREVRKTEMWMYDFDSLHIRAQGKWTRSPEAIAKKRAEIKDQDGVDNPDVRQYPDLRETSQEILEFAVDRKRVRYLSDDPGHFRQVKIWDGNELKINEKYYHHAQEHYSLYSTLKERMFHELLPCDFGWPRSQPHSFWYDQRDVNEAMDFYGRPADFKLVGRQRYREIPCYVLKYNVPDKLVAGLTFRWFVGQSDHLLYGLQSIRHGRPTGEHWTTDYREVVPGGWFPMKTGWTFYNTDKAGRTYMESTCDLNVIEFHLNERLSKELFDLPIPSGVKVQDFRSGQLRIYTQWSSLFGKPLPELKEFGVKLSPADVNDKMILVCFWDMEQRPSRHCITKLTEQAEQLKKKGVIIVAIQGTRIDQTALNDWVKKYNIPFTVGMVAGDDEETRFEWGVKSLPWLILTDRKHIVRAEGFTLSEIDGKLKQIDE